MENNALWQAIYDLYELLIEKVNDESAYQSYFEKYPVAFSPFGFDVALPFEKKSPCKLPFDSERNYRPEPDFICGIRRTGEVCVFELKTPFEPAAITSRSDGNREKFRATIETYIAQATEYVDSIREREAARTVVSEALQIDRISSYSIVIVYGLHNPEDAATIARLEDKRIPKTQIVPYDGVFDALVALYSASRTDAEARSGWTYWWVVDIASEQRNRRSYVCDVGTRDHDRLSLYIENNEMIVECVNASTKRHRFSCEYKPDEIMLIRFEFAADDNGVSISLMVNNEELDLRVGRKPLQLKLNLNSLHLGSDIFGLNNARFKIFENGCVERTLNITERLGMYHYFKSKYLGK